MAAGALARARALPQAACELDQTPCLIVATKADKALAPQVREQGRGDPVRSIPHPTALPPALAAYPSDRLARGLHVSAAVLAPLAHVFSAPTSSRTSTAGASS